MPHTIQHVKLLPKQWECLASTSLRTLYSGAYRAGKSRLLCYRAVQRAQHPRARCGMTRKRRTDLLRTTFTTLVEPDGDLPPVLPLGSYTYRKQPGNESVSLHGGGKIILFGCDDPMRVRSLGLSDCVVDEVVELDADEWDTVDSRCSVSFTEADGSAHTPTLMAATNPDSPAHWLYKRFWGDKVDPSEQRVIETSVLDNYFLDDSYFRRLDRLVGVDRLRYVHGKWVASEGLVYWMWSPDRHVLHNPGPFDYYVAGVDWGFEDPAVCRVHGCWYEDGEHKSHVVAELYQPHLTTPVFTDQLRGAASQYEPIVFVVDPSAADLRAQMLGAGLETIAADNRIEAGIRCVQMSLGDNRLRHPAPPTLTMEPTCKDGNAEYGLYRWKQRPGGGSIGIPAMGEAGSLVDKPVDADNHAMDADRYARMAIVAGAGSRQGIVWLGANALGPASRRIIETPERAARRRPDVNDERFWGHGSTSTLMRYAFGEQ